MHQVDEASLRRMSQQQLSRVKMNWQFNRLTPMAAERLALFFSFTPRRCAIWMNASFLFVHATTPVLFFAQAHESVRGARSGEQNDRRVCSRLHRGALPREKTLAPPKPCVWPGRALVLEPASTHRPWGRGVPRYVALFQPPFVSVLPGPPRRRPSRRGWQRRWPGLPPSPTPSSRSRFARKRCAALK